MADNWFATMSSSPPNNTITYLNWNSMVTDISSNHMHNTTTAHSLNTWAGNTSINSVGTITVGSWHSATEAIHKPYITFRLTGATDFSLTADKYHHSSLAYDYTSKTFYPIKSGGTGGGITEVSQDTTPQLGGHLGGKNLYKITGVTYISSQNINITGLFSGAKISGVQLYKSRDIDRVSYTGPGLANSSYTGSGLKWDGNKWIPGQFGGAGGTCKWSNRTGTGIYYGDATNYEVTVGANVDYGAYVFQVSGATFLSGTVRFKGNQLSGLAMPTFKSGVATKKYVDRFVSGQIVTTSISSQKYSGNVYSGSRIRIRTYISGNKYSGSTIKSNYLSSNKISGVQLFKSKDIYRWNSANFQNSGLKWNQSLGMWVSGQLSGGGGGGSQWSTDGGGIYYNVGDVRIGTTSDYGDYKLQVAGDTFLSGGLRLKGRQFSGLAVPSHNTNVVTQIYLQNFMSGSKKYGTLSGTKISSNQIRGYYISAGKISGTRLFNAKDIKNWNSTAFTNSGLKWNGSQWVSSQVLGGASQWSNRTGGITYTGGEVSIGSITDYGAYALQVTGDSFLSGGIRFRGSQISGISLPSYVSSAVNRRYIDKYASGLTVFKSISSQRVSSNIIKGNYISGAFYSGVKLYKGKDVATAYNSTLWHQSGLKWSKDAFGVGVGGWVVSAFGAGGGGLTQVVDDTSPALGGNLGGRNLYGFSAATFVSSQRFSGTSYSGSIIRARVYISGNKYSGSSIKVSYLSGSKISGLKLWKSRDLLFREDGTSEFTLDKYHQSSIKFDYTNRHWEPCSVAGGSSDNYTVKIDAGATAGYIGELYNNGVLRTDGTKITKTDGGDYVTIGIAENALAISSTANTRWTNYTGHSSNATYHYTQASITQVGTVATGTIKQAAIRSGSQYYQGYGHSSSTVVHLAKAAASGAMMKFNGTSWVAVSGAHMKRFPTLPAAASHKNQIISVSGGASQKTWVFASVNRSSDNAWQWIQLGVST